MRVFLSIDIEDESLLSRVSRIQSRLDQEAAKLKLVEKDSIHFTLRFFGDTSLSRTEEMRNLLGTLEIIPFTILIEGVGAFPSARRPNVIWIGVSQNAQQIAELKAGIDALLVSLGYPPEKGFKAHATIARVRAVKDRERTLRNLESLARESVGTMTVSSFRMTKSTLKPSGPVYETLWEIPSRKSA
jgi:2'-5' RNA ligase